MSRILSILAGASLCLYSAEVSELSWLAGKWTGTMGRATIEERWTEPAGGAMLAISRTVAGTRMVEFEYLRIVQKDGEIFYVAQPGGRSPTEFKMVSATTTRVVFENPKHDFPKQISYELDGDKLTATISGGEKKISFHFTRAK
ncbi:MAG: hypothetical protein FJW30_17440 [Acidobacteria bacterium]|nr:hypothetical protein [Acidobacteriota bacterium]